MMNTVSQMGSGGSVDKRIGLGYLVRHQITTPRGCGVADP